MIQPGCFGVPSVFSFSSRVCGKCEHGSACQSQAHSALLSAQVGFANKLLKQHDEHRLTTQGELIQGAALNMTRPMPKGSSKLAERFPLNEHQIALLSTLSKKPADYLRKLMVRNVDKIVLEAAERGQNAFTQDKHRPYHLALEMLLEGGITKPTLRAAYCEDLGWSEAAAFPQVAMVWQIFPAMGLARQQGCALIPSPSVRCKNSATHHTRRA